MPAKSKKQQALAAMDLERTREGKATRTGMTEAPLQDFASTKTTKLPEKVKSTRGSRRR
jgi:hypothetical protein